MKKIKGKVNKKAKRLGTPQQLAALVKQRAALTREIWGMLSRIERVVNKVVNTFVKENRTMQFSFGGAFFIPHLYMRKLQIVVSFREVNVRTMGQGKMNAALRRKAFQLRRALGEATGHRFSVEFEMGPQRTNIQKEGHYDPLAMISFCISA